MAPRRSEKPASIGACALRSTLTHSEMINSWYAFGTTGLPASPFLRPQAAPAADQKKSARRTSTRGINGKGALRFGLAAPMVAGDRFERSTFGLRPHQRPIKRSQPDEHLLDGINGKGALRFGLAAPMVAGARFERATFGL